MGDFAGKASERGCLPDKPSMFGATPLGLNCLVAVEASDSPLDWSIGFLQSENEPGLALLLEDCKLRIWRERDEWLALIDRMEADCYPLVSAALMVPTELYTEAREQMGRIGAVLEEAVGRLDRFTSSRGQRGNGAIRGADFDRANAPHAWQGMRFRSYSEVAIAKELDRANVNYLPNSTLRHGDDAGERRNLEPDFLIIDRHRIGIPKLTGRHGIEPSGQQLIIAAIGNSGSLDGLWRGSIPRSAGIPPQTWWRPHASATRPSL